MNQQHEPDLVKAWGKWFFIAAWISALAMATWGFQKILSNQFNPNQQAKTMQTESGVRKVVLERNRHGHYVVTGWINDQKVELMLDTGASDVSIPAHLAKTLDLKAGAASTYMTANGPITAYHTEIEKIQIGNIVLHNVRASLNPAVNDLTILVGMSFLKQLEFTQKGNQLILSQ